jgi:transaldolase
MRFIAAYSRGASKGFLNTMKVSIDLYQDGANIEDMRRAYAEGVVRGFTTNPTLMRKAGVTDYQSFALEAIKAIPDLPISFEVFSDDFLSMEREARIIAGWGGNTFIKVPITNTKGESAIPLIAKLSAEGYSLNITAVTTIAQVQDIVRAVEPSSRSIVSVFAGRIADTGRDPVPMMREAAALVSALKGGQLLWASPREVLNVIQAQEAGCHIITATPDILAKLSLFGKDLDEYSLETVKMFYDDACRAGYQLKAPE